MPVVLTNIGDATAKGKTTLKVYASVDDAISGDDLLVASAVNQAVSLKKGAAKSFIAKGSIPNTPGTLPAGEYFTQDIPIPLLRVTYYRQSG